MRKSFLICALLFFVPLCGAIEESLKQIPVNDKLFMKEFVKINFKWHQAAHVVYFDNKPVCLASAWLKSPQKPYMDVLWMKGWRSFQKYEHLFPHPNFIFNSQMEEEEDGWQAIHLFIVNKRALFKCLEKNLVPFRDVVGENFSFEWFVTELEKGTNLFDLIKGDEELLGILLGYGNESASLFKASTTQSMDHLKEAQKYCSIDVKMPKSCKLFPVTFMGNPESLETKNLVTEYESELSTFWNIYKKEDPLILFLKCICN